MSELAFGAEIRDLRPDDVDMLLAFINPLIAEDTYIDMSGAPLTRSEEAAFVAQKRAEMALGDGVMRLAVAGDRVLASGELRRYPGRRHHVAELGVTVSALHRDRGLGTAVVRDLVAQSSRLGVRRLVLRVFGNNERAQQVYRNCGFVEVGRTPEMVRFRGEDVDEIWMTRSVPAGDAAAPVPVSADVHRAAARLFASGVTVAAAAHGGRVHAIAATAFCSLSLDPPLVLLAVNHSGQLVDLARRAGHVGISILGESQREISEWAGSIGREPAASLPYAAHTARTGAPLIEGAIAWFDGEVQSITRHGDHIVVVALVVEAWAAAGADPLLYFSGEYHALGRSLGRRSDPLDD